MKSMLKRILFSLLTLLMIASAVIVGYSIYQPTPLEINTALVASDVLDYDSLKDYTLHSGVSAIHYYLFISPENNDSIYVVNTILKDTGNNAGLDLSKIIEFVDVSVLDQTNQLYRLNEDWNISTYPAFVACHVENDEIIVDNTLEWNANQPISTEDLRDWLIQNRILEDATF